jgi:hypothetical protein
LLLVLSRIHALLLVLGRSGVIGLGPSSEK